QQGFGQVQCFVFQPHHAAGCCFVSSIQVIAVDSHPDEGFTRLALRLQLAWACAGLSGVARSVLDALAIDCWGLGRKGYESELRPSQIASRIDKSKRQVNDAIKSLEAAGFVVRQSNNWQGPLNSVQFDVESSGHFEGGF